MTDVPAIRRQLQIQSGVVKRLTKESGLYIKEAAAQQLKLEKLIANSTDPTDWDIKNARKMLEESNKMIADSADRRDAATGKLRDLVDGAKNISDLAGDEEVTKASDLLEELTGNSEKKDDPTEGQKAN